jgi:hypothetical protein
MLDDVIRSTTFREAFTWSDMIPPLVRWLGAGAALGVATAGCVRHSGYDAQVTQSITRLRAATRPFHTLDSAVATGYARDVPECLVHEHHGAMGFHHVNRGYVDATVDVERPEILLYERLPGGQYRLNGVEFIVPYRAWPRDSVAPVLMGQQLKREDNLNIWYLHVWAWKKSADGLFSDFNADVRCPEGASKVFRPYERPGGAVRRPE